MPKLPGITTGAKSPAQDSCDFAESLFGCPFLTSTHLQLSCGFGSQ